jgi:hypothetical protein
MENGVVLFIIGQYEKKDVFPETRHYQGKPLGAARTRQDSNLQPAD